MDWFGPVIGMTYEEVCVVFNVWVQTGVLWLFALLAFVLSLRRYCVGNGNFVVVCMSGCFTLLYIVIFDWLIIRYGTELYTAFDLCVKDLVSLAKMFHTTYQIVNIIIFVVLWLVAMMVNVWLIIKFKK